MTIFRIQYFFERLCTWIYTEVVHSIGFFFSFPEEENPLKCEIVCVCVFKTTHAVPYCTHMNTYTQGHVNNKYADKYFTTKRIVRIQMPLSVRVKYENQPNSYRYTVGHFVACSFTRLLSSICYCDRNNGASKSRAFKL